MKVPKSMTEQQVIDQINIVVERISSKYTFHGYDVEDIKQEAFIICMDALERYEDGRPLENFLSVHLSNRLKNFIRDNYYIKGEEEKKKILRPTYLSKDDFVASKNEQVDNFIDASTVSELIDLHLPSKYRADYLKLLNNFHIPKKQKEFIINLIKDIASKHMESKE
jgi:RNA polymerase sigma factor (sigma-70 family)